MTRVQHNRRGSTYQVLGKGKVQTDTPLKDFDRVVCYQSEEDGSIWVRPESEFLDGRFTFLPDNYHSRNLLVGWSAVAAGLTAMALIFVFEWVSTQAIEERTRNLLEGGSQTETN